MQTTSCIKVQTHLCTAFCISLQHKYQQHKDRRWNWMGKVHLLLSKWPKDNIYIVRYHLSDDQHEHFCNINLIFHSMYGAKLSGRWKFFATFSAAELSTVLNCPVPNCPRTLRIARLGLCRVQWRKVLCSSHFIFSWSICTLHSSTPQECICCSMQNLELMQ